MTDLVNRNFGYYGPPRQNMQWTDWSGCYPGMSHPRGARQPQFRPRWGRPQQRRFPPPPRFEKQFNPTQSFSQPFGNNPIDFSQPMEMETNCPDVSMEVNNESVDPPQAAATSYKPPVMPGPVGSSTVMEVSPALETVQNSTSEVNAKYTQPVMLLNSKHKGLVYEVISGDGSLGQMFTIKVVVRGQTYCGTGRSKKLAKQEAAKAALMGTSTPLHGQKRKSPVNGDDSDDSDDDNCEGKRNLDVCPAAFYDIEDDPSVNNILETEQQALPTSSKGASLLTQTSFKSLEGRISPDTLRAISDMGFTHMTQIQDMCMPTLLEGSDLMGAAQTGSGKTLAFLVPTIELLRKMEFSHHHGAGAIVISPTRELAMQSYGVLKDLLKYHTLTSGLAIGGTKRKQEAMELSKGVNILIATPGRLLDHMQTTPGFVFNNLKCLIIDEADRILDIGFEHTMRQIIELLPVKRQTMLFSATQTTKTEDLARISLNEYPMYIGVDDKKDKATVEGLKQGYVVCPSEKRFLLLFSLLKKNQQKKIMVFFSSCNSVRFHDELLNYIALPVMCIHGRMKQNQRTECFFRFCNAKQGILLCTDVAARGLDIPQVDWIIQFDPPEDTKEYIHRVGRTARGEGGIGHALLILRPEELNFLKFLRESKVPLKEFECSLGTVSNIQPQLEALIDRNAFLKKKAEKGYKAYIRSYNSQKKNTQEIRTLDGEKVALSFGLTKPPKCKIGGGSFKKRSKWH